MRVTARLGRPPSNVHLPAKVLTSGSLFIAYTDFKAESRAWYAKSEIGLSEISLLVSMLTSLRPQL